LPFNLEIAHQLYETLFSQLADLVERKHLFIVLSGSLTSLPFHVLVTAKPKDAIPGNYADYGRVAWLARTHAVTTLPSLASLKALRRIDKSMASNPYIAFGNPLLVGRHGTDRRAWDKQACRTLDRPTPQRVAGAHELLSTAGLFSRGGLADVEEVRHQSPLPETADELCDVARSVGAKTGDVYLGGRATERMIKTLSADGKLSQARVVHFATHGLLAGETEYFIKNRAEPALLLSPPEQASEEDDGLLTASEVAQLKLNADWVIMSACNTAGADKPDAEALSGLARAFFYAGARALLVSHWAVDSESAVALTTKAIADMTANLKLGRAAALQRSMLALIDRGGRFTHPANWAPFVVVGEGAR
jgi:CHAT domain-containing protein